LLISAAWWQLGFIGDCGVGADSLPLSKLEPTGLLSTLSEDIAPNGLVHQTLTICDDRHSEL